MRYQLQAQYEINQTRISEWNYQSAFPPPVSYISVSMCRYCRMSAMFKKWGGVASSDITVIRPAPRSHADMYQTLHYFNKTNNQLDATITVY